MLCLVILIVIVIKNFVMTNKSSVKLVLSNKKMYYFDAIKLQSINITRGNP